MQQDSGDAGLGTAQALGVPPPAPPPEEGGGFNFMLFGLLLGVAVLVAVQNLWLRRRAKRQGDAEEP